MNHPCQSHAFQGEKLGTKFGPGPKMGPGLPNWESGNGARDHGAMESWAHGTTSPWDHGPMGPGTGSRDQGPCGRAEAQNLGAAEEVCKAFELCCNVGPLPRGEAKPWNLRQSPRICQQRKEYFCESIATGSPTGFNDVCVRKVV